ncbi:MAG: hypothetical protein F4X08_12695 [Gemmatimonadetes bacterium]|nr:hypothetical protein [Gemmatimonadota bacterium]
MKWGRTEFLVVGLIAAGLAAWVLWLMPNGDSGETDSLTAMRLAYRLDSYDHMTIQFLKDDDNLRETFMAHKELLEATDFHESKMIANHPDDDALADLIEGRRAERTAVAMVTLVDFMSSPNVDVLAATVTPIVPVVVAAPSASDDSPSFIMAKEVIFECAQLARWYDERSTYAHLGKMMSHYEDEGGFNADFDRDEARAALDSCGAP